jgi:RNase adaptor protein for sRNA GlmZ degradation
MKLVIMYGPPAAGKLTVAKELAVITSARVFHNHHTIDLAREVMTKEQAAQTDVVMKLRQTIFEAAAEVDADLIFTVVYEYQVDDEYMQQLVEPVIKAGGQVCYVLLKPDKDQLVHRVTSESRRAYTKIQERELLDEVMGEHEFFKPIPDSETLEIDNTDLPPAGAAQRIKDHFKL